MKPRSLSGHDSRAFPILYVDDEPANLRTFELSFGREFTILTAESAEEGMRVLNDHPVAVVLSDHKMPGMTGVEFLRWVREFDESAVRILVTAYGDVETLGAAINDGRIYRYIPKPWDPDELGPTLRRAIERYALDRDRSALLDDVTRLGELSRALHAEPTPERVLRRAARAVQEEFGFDGVAALVFDRAGRKLEWAAIEPRDEVAEAVASISLARETAPFFFEQLAAGALQTLRADDVMELERPVRDWINEVSADQLVVVPLTGEGGVVGALAIDNRRGGRRFGADDRSLLEGLATQTATVVEKARTAVALEASSRELERCDRLALLGSLWQRTAPELDSSLMPLGTLLRGEPVEPSREERGEPGWEDALAGLERVRQRLGALERLGQWQGPCDGLRPVELSVLAGEVVSLLGPTAAAGRVTLDLEAAATGSKVLGEPLALQSLLAALLDCAIQTVGSGGRVRIALGPDLQAPDEALLVEVSHRGPESAPKSPTPEPGPASPGVAVQPDVSRQPGLRLAAQVARAHGGSLAERGTRDGGRCWEVRLPCEEAAPLDAPE